MIKMVWDNINLRMVIFTKDTLQMERDKEKEDTHGMITVSMKEIGSRIECMAMENILLVMG